MHERSPCNVRGCLIWRNICHAQSAIRHYLRLVNRGHAQTCAAGMVEWAAGRAVGFSAILSLGDRSMSTSATCLIISPSTATRGAILLYIESIHDVQKFMSAAPAAARAKPVVVVKSGRHAQGARAAQLIPAKPLGSIVREARAKSYPSLCGR
jgi:hypothetical protein